MKVTSQKVKELQEAGHIIVYIPKVEHPVTKELIDINDAYVSAFSIDYFEFMDLANKTK
jgi:hypothetical protein